MHHQTAPTDPDDKATWINQRVVAEVRRREALDISAYALAKEARCSISRRVRKACSKFGA